MHSDRLQLNIATALEIWIILCLFCSGLMIYLHNRRIIREARKMLHERPPMTQADTGAGIVIPEDLRKMHEIYRNPYRCGLDNEVVVTLIERIARLESELAQAQARLKNMNEPFSYGECEQSHELAKSDFKDAIDELVHCVDNANRYLNRRIAINQELAARTVSGEKCSEEKVPIPDDLREFYERIEGIVPDSRTIRERRELMLYKRIASLEAANRGLMARLTEMGKPVTDEEIKRLDPVCVKSIPQMFCWPPVLEPSHEIRQ